MGGRFGGNLSHSLNTMGRGITLDVKSTCEEIINLSDDFVHRNLRWSWVLHYLVNFEELLLFKHSPVIGKDLKRHLKLFNKLISKDWKSQLLIFKVVSIGNVEVDCDLWTVVEGIGHHGHHNGLRRSAIRIVADG